MLKRIRHRHGFGVHSPYAYRLIKEAIEESRRYGYYAYHDEELEHLGREARRNARRIIRINAFLGRLRSRGAEESAVLNVADAISATGCPEKWLPRKGRAVYVMHPTEELERGARDIVMREGGVMLSAKGWFYAEVREFMSPQVYEV